MDNENIQEIHFVEGVNTGSSVFAIKTKSHLSYNFYNVVIVHIGVAGSYPVEISEDFAAVNLAESFYEEGSLPNGTYGLMIRIGETNVFTAFAL